MEFDQLILTANDCYKAGRTITPIGVFVHSTGANNPNISRYVQPVGTSGNHWNQGGITKCVHGFLGYDAKGEVGFTQTLPWNHRGWHAGGAANNTHIGFEICEDDLSNREYFDQTYQKAAEVVAYLCIEYDFDPLAPNVIINHAEGYQLGVASNHADTDHWWGIYGKTMDDFRVAVQEEMKIMKQAEFNQLMAVWQATQNALEPSDWSQEARKWAEDQEIITGSGDAGFQYKRDCTREELVQILWKQRSKD
ncbi:MAG: peptidoglycan recognition family protein [Eubacteriales bacterium]